MIIEFIAMPMSLNAQEHVPKRIFPPQLPTLERPKALDKNTFTDSNTILMDQRKPIPNRIIESLLPKDPIRAIGFKKLCPNPFAFIQNVYTPPPVCPFPPTKSFTLVHQNFDLQNIFVDAQGSVVGIIDWDGVTTAPPCIDTTAPLALQGLVSEIQSRGQASQALVPASV
ncbi:hypothetical protein CC78DRAFT_530154 [Lojkania enalia]|uniref:Aminoglycoside phosphotransferase domain-containing protein n=1 Tax=Lojkania enalia TaxID=147567 RepID=A0A9P4N3B0_9PLEO|nr:hypothetical protein CC78DRAFT_530154 [Didymosphaeria enalia]